MRLCICQFQNTKLTQQFRSLPSGKAPGVGGFPSSFFHSYCNIFGGNICSAMQPFFHSGNMSNAWKAIFITLIPKVQNPVRTEDYWLISLCSTLYKVITKIIVSRLKPILSRLVFKEQVAFVLGRSISKNSLLLQETFCSLKRVLVSEPMMIEFDMERDRI